jgi:hypothetical protein
MAPAKCGRTKHKPVAMTPLARAYRGYEARLRSGWEHNYDAAFDTASAGDVSRLADLLRARRPLADADFERLAEYLERTARRGRGQPQKSANKEAARLAETLLAIARKPVSLLRSRNKIIEAACESVNATSGPRVDSAAVHDLLRRGRSRRE